MTCEERTGRNREKGSRDDIPGTSIREFLFSQIEFHEVKKIDYFVTYKQDKNDGIDILDKVVR